MASESTKTIVPVDSSVVADGLISNYRGNPRFGTMVATLPTSMAPGLVAYTFSITGLALLWQVDWNRVESSRIRVP